MNTVYVVLLYRNAADGSKPYGWTPCLEGKANIRNTAEYGNARHICTCDDSQSARVVSDALNLQFNTR